MPTALVRNGRVVTASESYEADLYVDGKIALVGQGLSLPADTVIDASGCLVLPGGIDAHTHLDMPAGELTSADDFESGTRAAAFGGTTAVVTSPPRSPASRSPPPSRRGWRRPRARRRSTTASTWPCARSGRRRSPRWPA